MVWFRFGSVGGIVLAAFLFSSQVLVAQPAADSRLITVYDRGVETVFITQEKTIGDALTAQGITVSSFDTVEPSPTEEMVAPNYWVNIYRARSVVVEDGPLRTQIFTPYQSTNQIVESAGITLYPEDIVTLDRSENLLSDGLGIRVSIARAVDFSFNLYGRVATARTHAATVGAMLEEKQITLTQDDRVVPSADTPLQQGMSVRIWREGKQTLTVEESVPYGSEIVYDADRPVGYRAVQKPGVLGRESVSYEIEIKDGAEVSRKEIARIAAVVPVKEVTAIGIKGLESGLTRNKGAIHFTDSNGVVHRETYYDLNMSVVMGACGQGGKYSVRFDGMKIDSEGYIIIAANYARYPKCSIVETSAGLGRVYDTGGFVLRHPDGFDLATDWTVADGR